ncbi:Syntaxin-18 [Holothuria leucospilota]|uniref:Syntaxin-18 n=1 Tax=Holothuria leucospilota TaxID=206669 RepID=A0A9Q0YS98_HOLLE|nr:Syntaxin-18 [Holothuria leucospilota]
MADITPLFKASIKTVRTRNKALGLGKETGKSSILSHRQKSDFAQKTKEVVGSISKLKDFLLKHQKEYINASSHLSSSASLMSDSERDQIDQDAQEIIRTCSESIRLIKAEAAKQRASEQVKKHREAVFELLDAYLKGVCKIYSEQRAIRVKRVVDKKRISRLQPEQLILAKQSISSQQEGQNVAVGATVSTGEKRNENTVALEEKDEKPDFDDGFSPEELEAFEQENRSLFNEMTNLVDEVRQIEGKVVEITKLQEVFAEKVLTQSAEIDRIGDTAVKVTENIKQGNEDVRQAIKNTASLRVWILFFLVMCSFSLLFLDWYS